MLVSGHELECLVVSRQVDSPWRVFPNLFDLQEVEATLSIPRSFLRRIKAVVETASCLQHFLNFPDISLRR